MFTLGGGHSQDSELPKDVNFADTLLELQLNWCETMDHLDALLDVDLPSFVSLSLDNIHENK